MNDVFFIGAHESNPTLDASNVGGKAANLIRLDALGLRVPPALVLPTSVCRRYLELGALPDDLAGSLAGALRRLENATGLTLGHTRPLLLSVRSSPPSSMPGMLETVLNVGLTERALSGLIRRTGNGWLAWDTYRRSIRSFAETVLRLPAEPFDRLTAQFLADTGAEAVQELDPLSLRDLSRDCADLVQDLTGTVLPHDPFAQIVAAVEAVLQSWASPRACEYRRLNGLDDCTGTAVLIQAMVFGNSGARSGSGVGFTRSPVTGDDELYVDFLFNAQGEDVVSGRHAVTDGALLADTLPDVWSGLQTAKHALEQEFLDMQDFEFTVDEGQLFFLQTRSGKRTPWAAMRIAADLVRAGIVDRPTALKRLEPYDLDSVVRVAVRPGPNDVPVGHAVPAGIGAATGEVVFDAERAQERAVERDVVLVRPELSTDDIAGLSAAVGILTTYGGRTSHAAVVARHLGKVCLVGCVDLRVDEAAHVCSIGDRLFREGDLITLDGDAGFVYAGRVPIVSEHPVDALATIRAWRSRGGR